MGVVKKLGVGLMALFGYPGAHENDSESPVAGRHSRYSARS
jgi:hypothetical protein